MLALQVPQTIPPSFVLHHVVILLLLVGLALWLRKRRTIPAFVASKPFTEEYPVPFPPDACGTPRTVGDIAPCSSELLAFLSQFADIDALAYRYDLASRGVRTVSDLFATELDGIPACHARAILLRARTPGGCSPDWRLAVQKRQNYRSSVFAPSAAVSYEGLPTLRGFLFKRARSPFAFRLQRRWFLTHGAYLQYYESATRSVIPLGVIDLRVVHTIQAIRADPRDLELIWAGGRLRLRTASASEAQHWVSGLQQRQMRLWGVEQVAEPAQTMSLAAQRRPPTQSQASQRAQRQAPTRPSLPKTLGQPRGRQQEPVPGPATSQSDAKLTHQQPGALSPLELVAERSNSRAKRKHVRDDPLDDTDDFANDRERASAAELRRLQPLATTGQAIRFLRARGGDVAKAEAFLTRHLHWRARRLPIRGSLVRAELDKSKYILAGRDQLGQRVIVLQGRLMGPGTYSSVRNCVDAVAFAFERLCNEYLAPTELFTVIFNRNGMSLGHYDLAWTKGVADLLQHNYPERLYKAVVVPSNVVFRSVWAMAKPFFDPRTAAKVELAPSNQSLLDLVPADQLLTDLGGHAANTFDPSEVFPCEGWDIDSDGMLLPMPGRGREGEPPQHRPGALAAHARTLAIKCAFPDHARRYTDTEAEAEAADHAADPAG